MAQPPHRIDRKIRADKLFGRLLRSYLVLGLNLSKMFSKRVVLLLVVLGYWLPQNLTAQSSRLKSKDEKTIVVTVSDNPKATRKKKKGKPKHRIQLNTDSSHVKLQMTRFNRISKAPRKVLIQYSDSLGRRKKAVARRARMPRAIVAEQGPILAENRARLKETLGEIELSRYELGYRRNLHAFIKGRKGGDVMYNQWHTLASLPLSGMDSSGIKVKLRTGLFRKNEFATDTLPARYAFGFPAIEFGQCEPFERSYQLKKLRGGGFDQLVYQSYRFSQRKIIRKNFLVYFEKNKADVSERDLTEAIDFLRNNDMAILRATIEGFSSIEGTDEANTRLQHQRARKMINVLQRYNNEPVLSDTVLVTEPWSEFRNNIKVSPYKWLDTLTNERLRETVNTDPLLLEKLEPYLKAHRRASLRLTMSRKLSRDERLQKVVDDFNALSRLIAMTPNDLLRNMLDGLALLEIRGRMNPEQMTRLVEGKLLGIMAYLDKMAQSGEASFDDLAYMVDNCSAPSHARILLFHHLIKTHEASRAGGTVQWDSLFAERKWNNFFEVAHSNIIELIQNAISPAERNKRISQAVDIQFHTIKYVKAGLLDPEILCLIDYPDEKMFYGLKLHHYAIAHELSREAYFPCYSFQGSSPHTVVQNKTFSESTYADFERRRHGGRFLSDEYHSSKYRKATFSLEQKSDYYYFIKKLFLGKEKDIREFVSTSDMLIEFDLLHLLQRNVSVWDPVTNHFYDKEIRLPEMDMLTKKLKGMDGNICTEQCSQLYLDYHLKALIYLEQHFIPGDKVQMRIADEAMAFISEYYAKRAYYLFPKLTLHILDQLHTFYPMATRKASTEYAFNLLKAVKGYRMLTEQEQKRWEVYIRMYELKDKDTFKSKQNKNAGRKDDPLPDAI